jgi:hypothetical protein
VKIVEAEKMKKKLTDDIGSSKEGRRIKVGKLFAYR